MFDSSSFLTFEGSYISNVESTQIMGFNNQHLFNHVFTNTFDDDFGFSLVDITKPPRFVYPPSFFGILRKLRDFNFHLWVHEVFMILTTSLG